MKTKLLSNLILVLFSAQLGFCQDVHSQRIVPGNVIIKFSFLPFLFETSVSGKIYAYDSKFEFIPDTCIAPVKNKWVYTLFPCNNHLFKTSQVDYRDIVKIRRRNYLFIIPNRLFIETNRGNEYLISTNMFTNSRRTIFRAIKAYQRNHQFNQPAVSPKS